MYKFNRMSSFTVNKLKKNLNIAKPNSTVNPNVTVITTGKFIVPVPTNGGLESNHLLYEINKCGYTIIKGVSVPITTSNIPPPISPEIKPASVATSQLIAATILASVNPADPSTRFSQFFPAPIPPPQYLQPGFVKYKINNEPRTRQIPCIGYRRYDP
jgi:hypothetical protein